MSAAKNETAVKHQRIDKAFLERLGVDDSISDEEWLVLKDNKVLTVAILLAFSSKDELRSLKTVKDQKEMRLGEGTIVALWQHIEEARMSIVVPMKGVTSASIPPQQIVSDILANCVFPSSLSAYEFPNFSLPANNPNHESVKSCDVKAFWGNLDEPDFLLTGLDNRVVELTDLFWDPQRRRLSLTNRDGLGGVNPLDPIVLISTSGSGKTRWIYERAYREFGGLYLGFIADENCLNLFIRKLPKSITSAEEREVREGLEDRISVFFTIQALVLDHLRREIKNFQPRHWLAFLLGHRYIIGRDVFFDIFLALEKSKISFSVAETKVTIEQSGIRFIALDEAQELDNFLPNTFARRRDGAKRSILGPLADTLLLNNVQLVLAGTGLNIKSSIELLNSGLAKTDSHFQRVRTFGIATMFDADNLRREIAVRGYLNGPIDEFTLNYCTGRPRFGMRLASALLKNLNLVDFRARLLESMAKDIDRLSKHRVLLKETIAAAKQWCLKGLGGITTENAELTLEYGLANLSSKRVRVSDSEQDDNEISDSSRHLVFHINEPLIADLLMSYWKEELVEVSTLSAVQLGTLLEEAVAFHAKDLVSAIVSMSPPAHFKGEWKVPSHGGTMRSGISAKPGSEPAALKDMMQHLLSKGYGCSVVFPSTTLGADLVVLARDEASGKCLLLFVQCKASLHATTPSAFKSLHLPYHENRKKVPKIAESYSLALAELEDIMFRPDVRVVFCVFKFPGGSNQAEIRPATYTSKTHGALQIIEAIIDKRNARHRLPKALYEGLRAFESVKACHAHMWPDDDEDNADSVKEMEDD